MRRARQKFADQKWAPQVRAGEPRALEYAVALWREIAREQSGEVEENDGIDLMHAGVSIASCDIVVLDAHWAELAQRVDKPPRRAQVFSGKHRDREALFRAIEEHPTMPCTVWEGPGGPLIGWP